MKTKTKIDFYFHVRFLFHFVFRFCFHFCFHFRFRFCLHFRFWFCFHFPFSFCFCFHFRFYFCFRFCFSFIFWVFIFKFSYRNSRPLYTCKDFMCVRNSCQFLRGFDDKIEKMQNENFVYYKECTTCRKTFSARYFLRTTVAFQTNKNSLMKKPPTMTALLLVFQIKVNL